MRTDDAAELAQTLFEEIGDAAFVVDPKTMRLLNVNPMAQRLTGLPLDKILALPLSDLFRSAGDEGLGLLQRALHTTQTFHSQEGYFLRRGLNGVWIPVNLTLTRLHTEHKQLGLVLARDVTERHLAEGQLRAANADLERRVQERTADLARVNETLRAEVAEHKRTGEALELFRALLDRTNDSIEVIDPDTAQVLDVNERACLVHGYTRQEYLSLRIPDLDPTTSGPSTWAQLVENLRRLGSIIHEGQHRRKDGTLFPVEVHANYIRLDREYLVAVVRDITERKRAEEAIRQSELRKAAILEAALDAVVTVDASGRIIEVNTAAEKTFGYTRQELIGQDMSSRLILSSARELHARGFRQHLETGEASVIGRRTEMTALRADGREIPIEIALTRIGANEPPFFTAHIRDLTDRKKLEAQLRQSQKMEGIGQLAGGVAHDFNNLLTVINGYSEVLLVDLPMPDPRRAAVTAIREAGERAARLTGQLLAFSRKALVEPKVLDLNELIDSTGKMLRRLIGEDITLTTVLSPGLSWVKVDPGQVEQVVMNLAVNARDAMPRGGRLTLETANIEVHERDLTEYLDLKPGQHVRLTVSDTGCGMTDDVKARVFEPFFTTKAVGKGTGLGLATVYGIVKQAGGHISVDSRVGAGTTFTILLPAVSCRAAPAVPRETQVAPRGSETVLLAEDEDGVRRLSRMALEMQGYTVLDAGFGADTVKTVESHAGPIHLLVTDVVMPDLGGRDLAEAVRARRPGIKVLYISGYTDDAVVRHGVSEATDAFLPKPFTPLTLARKVRAVLDEAASSPRS